MKRATIEAIREACLLALYDQGEHPYVKTAMGVEMFRRAAINFYQAKSVSNPLQANRFRMTVDALVACIVSKVDAEKED